MLVIVAGVGVTGIVTGLQVAGLTSNQLAVGVTDCWNGNFTRIYPVAGRIVSSEKLKKRFFIRDSFV